MSDAFDPYYKWLGIPPEDQPPDHYRLLGVKQFEPDAEVIATAADRQMMLVRTFQAGPRSEVSQRLLNELSAAKLCLLDPGRRAAYDEELRAAAPLPEVLAAWEEAPLADVPQSEPAAPTPARPAGAGASRLSAALRKPIVAVGAGCGAALCLLLIVVLLSSGGSEPDLRFQLVGAPSVQVGQPWSARSELQDPDAAKAGVRFRLGRGAPAGLEIDARSGRLRWQPHSPGVYELTVEATAGGAASQSARLSVRVVPTPVAPRLEPIADQEVPEGEPQHWPLEVTNPAAAPVHYRLAEAPEGLQLDDAEGALRWTPTEDQGPGEYEVSVQLWRREDRLPADEMSFRVTVQEANRGPAFDAVADQEVFVARPWRFQLSATDPDLPPNRLTYSLIGAPRGMQIDDASGKLSWTPPTTVGATHRVTVAVRDDAEEPETATTSFRVLLRDVGAAQRRRAFAGRREPHKSKLLEAGGGDARSEAAVGRALDWLARQQQPDGSWKLSGPYANGATLADNAAAATAMATLAFLAAGHTPAEGEYRDVVARAAASLRQQQDVQGSFPVASSHAKMYTHALCTTALCELYGMTEDETFRAPAERAVKFCIDNQGREGGWRYAPRDRGSDTSVTGGVLMALTAARAAGLDVPQKTFDRASGYLDLAARDGGSHFAYLSGTSAASHSMTAEGLLARSYLGWPTDDARLQRGVAGLLEEAAPKWNDRDVYLWHYATWLLHRAGGPPWQRWNAQMRDVLVANQTVNGAERGSWDPTGDEWGPHAGRLYTTCFSTYILEVYYRHPRP